MRKESIAQQITWIFLLALTPAYAFLPNLRKGWIVSARTFRESSPCSTWMTASGMFLEDASRASGSKNHRGLRSRRRKQRPPRKKTKKQLAKISRNDTSLNNDMFLAMDCEMVGVGPDGIDSILARICIIDWNGTALLDCFVKPTQHVTNYRTRFSGVTEDDLTEGRTNKTLLEFHIVKSTVQSLLHNKILVGHALQNDLGVLNITHPWFDTRDTARASPFTGDGRKRRKLRDLAKFNLKREIQGSSHCPKEDALAALDLYKLVRHKWEKSIAHRKKKRSQWILEYSSMDVTATLPHQLPDPTA